MRTLQNSWVLATV